MLPAGMNASFCYASPGLASSGEATLLWILCGGDARCFLKLGGDDGGAGGGVDVDDDDDDVEEFEELADALVEVAAEIDAEIAEEGEAAEEGESAEEGEAAPEEEDDDEAAAVPDAPEWKQAAMRRMTAFMNVLRADKRGALFGSLILLFKKEDRDDDPPVDAAPRRLGTGRAYKDASLEFVFKTTRELRFRFTRRFD